MTKTKKNIRVDVSIVTKDRYESLLRTLFFLLGSTKLPETIILVDSSIKKYDLNYPHLIQSVLAKSKIHFLYKKTPGYSLSKARNQALISTKATHIAFLDDDQIPSSDWIENIYHYLRKHTSVTGVGGKRQPFYTKNYWNQVWSTIEERRYVPPQKVTFLPTGNSVFSISFLKKNGLKYSTLEGVIEDVEFCNQILEKGGTITYCPDIIVMDTFRTNIVSFFKQWFLYGIGTFSFHYKYENSHRILGFLKSFLNSMRTLSLGEIHFSYIPGFFVRNVAFTIGYWTQCAIFFSKRVNKKI
jgi:cellulose synthase/poly-beta-1,6-N-acetylglucosamine synthase-like glycosyltransferase